MEVVIPIPQQYPRWMRRHLLVWLHLIQPQLTLIRFSLGRMLVRVTLMWLLLALLLTSQRIVHQSLTLM